MEILLDLGAARDALQALPLPLQVAVGAWALLTVGLVLSAVLLRPKETTSTPVSMPDGAAAHPPDPGVEPFEKWRLDHDVRRLRDVEVGLPLEQLPSGVYAFVDPTTLGSVAVSHAERYGPHCLEVHIVAGRGLVLMCYVTQEVALRFGTGQRMGTFNAYAETWSEASTMVAIPWSRVTLWTARSFANGSLLELMLSETATEES